MGPEQANEEVDRIMSQIDTNNNGFIDYTGKAREKRKN